MDTLLAVAGALIALTQIVIAVAVYSFSRRQQTTQIRIQRAVRIQDWANECLCALTEAWHFGLLEEADFSISGGDRIRKHDLLNRLSTLIDQGRLFFNNVTVGNYGEDKSPAHHGLRPLILDPLVDTYRAVQATSVTLDRDHLYKRRGDFISLVQYEVDSKWVRKAIIPTTPGQQAGRSTDGNY